MFIIVYHTSSKIVWNISSLHESSETYRPAWYCRPTYWKYEISGTSQLSSRTLYISRKNC